MNVSRRSSVKASVGVKEIFPESKLAPSYKYRTNFLANNLQSSEILLIFATKLVRMGKEECIKLLKKYMNILKSEYGITSLSLFGSTARGSQNPNSDIDLFVDTKTPNPFLLMDAKEFLENETGSSVDIVRNHQNLNPKLKKRILKDGILIF